MARVKTFAINGSLLPGDLNSIEDDYEAAFSHYKNLWAPQQGAPSSGQMASAGVASMDAYGDGNTVQSGAGSFSGKFVSFFDPADYAIAGRTTKLRITGAVTVNSVAIGQALTFGLYPMTVAYGASGSINTYSFGAVVSGTTVTVPNPATSSLTPFTGPDFPAPAAGIYVVGYAIAGAATSGTAPSMHTQLQYRHV